jgi:hypothetical protein
MKLPCFSLSKTPTLYIQSRAVLYPIVQVHILNHSREIPSTRSIASRRPLRRSHVVIIVSIVALGILDMENGLVRLRKRRIGITLRILSTLLIDRPLHIGQHRVDDIASVLQPDRQSTAVRL